MKRIRLSLLALVAAVVPAALLGAVLAPVSAASAYSTALCTGFTSCEARGYSTHGYAAAYKTKWWSMTAGHNCTNYTAFMVNNNGRLTAKPSGTAGARYWNDAAKGAGVLVTGTPQAGDVAYWEYKYHGAGSNGHVAYVEQVAADGALTISEDNLGGDFRVRKMSKGNSKAWPSGFIRYPQSDGSPSGKVVGVTATREKITVAGYTVDPDGGSATGQPSARPTVVWGESAAATAEEAKAEVASAYDFGPLGEHWSTWFGQGSFRGDKTLTVFARNVETGQDQNLGTYTVTVPYWTKVSGRVSATTVKRYSRPWVTGAVTNADDPAVSPVGTLELWEGSRKRFSVSLAEADQGRYALQLAEQGKGTHYFTAVFYPGKGFEQVQTSRMKLVVR